MRALLALLLLANLSFLALTQGWLAPWAELSNQQQREPERLARQLNPESVRPLDAPAASAALRALTTAPGCVQAGPFDETQLAMAETVLLALPLAPERWQRRRVEVRGPWLVVVGGFADSVAQARRQEALRRDGYAVDALPETGARPAGLALGRFDDKASAEAALAQWRQRGISDAILAPPAAAAYWLRLERVDSVLRDRLMQLPPIAPGAGFAPCGKTP